MEHSISRVCMSLSCYINGSLNVTCTNTSLTSLATWDYKLTAVILKPHPPFHRLQHVCLNYLGRKLLLFVFLYHFYYFVALCPTSVILISAACWRACMNTLPILLTWSRAQMMQVTPMTHLLEKAFSHSQLAIGASLGWRQLHPTSPLLLMWSVLSAAGLIIICKLNFVSSGLVLKIIGV